MRYYQIEVRRVTARISKKAFRVREKLRFKVSKYYTEISNFCRNIFTICKTSLSINIEVLRDNEVKEVKTNTRKWHVIQLHFHFHIH